MLDGSSVALLCRVTLSTGGNGINRFTFGNIVDELSRGDDLCPFRFELSPKPTYFTTIQLEFDIWGHTRERGEINRHQGLFKSRLGSHLLAV